MCRVPIAYPSPRRRYALNCPPWERHSTRAGSPRSSPAGSRARSRASRSQRAWAGDPAHWPWATFAANLAGALILGYVAARLRDGHARLLLGTGFCGALTTFSTMQLELLRMLDGEHYALAAGYALASLALGLAAVALGRRLATIAGAPAVAGGHR